MQGNIFRGQNPMAPEVKNACFVAGTLVHASEGLKPIERIQVGDLVLSKPENGDGKTAFKPVVRTVRVEDSETWYVSWEDPQLHDDWAKKRISFEEYSALSGNTFVITTPNPPFWVVKSDDEYLKYCGSGLYIDPPWPTKEWIRADHLVQGMSLQLANGRIVTVLHSKPVYKTDREGQAWVDINEHMLGLLFETVEGVLRPSQSIYADKSTGDLFLGLVANPNEAYGWDYPIGSAKDSWFRSTVYNMEVDEFHTCFVDTLGVLVHDANACAAKLA